MELLTPDWTKFVDDIVPNLISLAKTSKLVDGHGYAHVVRSPFVDSNRINKLIFQFRNFSGNHRIFENSGIAIRAEQSSNGCDSSG